jgi:molecular chaperone GrpE
MSEEEDYKDKYLRAIAAGENQRKQNRKDVELAREAGRKETVLAFLPIVDDLDRAEAASSSLDQAGFNAIRSKARSTLAILDVQAIETTVGKPFAADSMEAVAKVPTKALAAGNVAAEIARGYRIGDRLLRPAQVVVAEDESE